MMENISTGLTWDQIQELFDADSKYSLILNNCQRRASLKKRKNGIEEDRKVWRLIIQKDHKNFDRTVFRKNLKDAPDALGSSVALDKIVAQMNNVICL
jgi:chromosome segregation and condensation protein ScpB